MAARPLSEGAALREAALAAERAGRCDEAAILFDRALAAAPDDPALSNSGGSFHARNGRHERALALFDRALAIDPRHIEAAINRAIALGALGRTEQARVGLLHLESQAAGSARYWSVRAAAERADGVLVDAASSYDRCLALAPDRARALHGRARVALERDEPDAEDRFVASLTQTPDDLEAWLGRAQAALSAGRTQSALEIVTALAKIAPGWTAALELLAQLRWEAGDPDYCAHYALVPPGQRDHALILSWAARLAAGGNPGAAADILAACGSDAPDLLLAEAVYAGEAGDDLRAARLFASLPSDLSERPVQEARHLLRMRDADAAEACLARAIAADPVDVRAWALRDIAWRLTGDRRHGWLHGQPGLWQTIELDLDEAALATTRAYLNALHDHSARPIGQSVREGTQTRGGLFDRHDRGWAELRSEIGEALSSYRAGLPPADPTHPLLRDRDAPWRIVGSWSVRFDAAGWHTEHIHAAGRISSAAYLQTPPLDPTDPHAGALELGRSPPDLRLDLPPLTTIIPAAGRIALFPSTLYHGTRRFTAGRRLSVAFDVQPQP